MTDSSVYIAAGDRPRFSGFRAAVVAGAFMAVRLRRAVKAHKVLRAERLGRSGAARWSVEATSFSTDDTDVHRYTAEAAQAGIWRPKAIYRLRRSERDAPPRGRTSVHICGNLWIKSALRADPARGDR